MKLCLIAFAVIAAVAADVRSLPSNMYLSPIESSSQLTKETPSEPVQQQVEQGELLQHVEYQTPETTQSPVSEAVHVHSQTSSETYPAHELETDGYHYKTNRRVVHRRLRRDVSHLPSSNYLPPVQNNVAVDAHAPEHELVTVDAAVPEVAQPVSQAPVSELADDGYHYKSQRRVVYRRQRRDVSHLESNKYLPPIQEGTPEIIPSNEYLPSLSGHFAGFPANNYVVPVPEYAQVNTQASLLEVAYVPGQVTLPDVKQVHSHVPGSEVAQVVSQAPVSAVSQLHNQALVPEEEKVNSQVPVPESMLIVNPNPDEIASVAPVEVAPLEVEPAHDLATDGYHYKTYRRVVYRRHRRDISHLSSNEYLPPLQREVSVEVPTNEYLPSVPQLIVEANSMQFPEVKEVHSVLSVPGVMLLVSPAPVTEVSQNLVDENVQVPVDAAPVKMSLVEAVSAQVVPVKDAPVEVSAVEVAPVKDDPVEIAPVEVSPDEVAPVEVSPVEVAPVDVSPVEAAPAHELSADGYHYKTHRRVVYRRHRRDVSHLSSNGYLPPLQREVSVEVPTNEYLPSVPQLIVEANSMQFPEVKEDRSVLSVPEVMLLVSPAPVTEVSQNLVDENVQVPVDAAPVKISLVEAVSAQVAPVKDGPVEVSPVEVAPVKDDPVEVASVEVSPDEVAPVEVSSVEVAPVEVSPVEVAPVEVSPVEVAPVVVAPIEVAPIEVPPVGVAPVVVARVETAPVEAAPAHELATDGYHYKTQRRVVYRRQRRDVSHLSSNEYLPPVSKVQNQVHVADHSISLAPVKGTPVDAAPVKDAPVEVSPDEVAPVEVSSVEVAPVEVSPVEVAPVEVSPVEVAPVVVAPIEVAPIEVPPVGVAPVVVARVETAPVEASPAHELATDGYHYKTQRRVVYRRQRRDVSHLSSNEYLPPVSKVQNQVHVADHSISLAPVKGTPVDAAPVKDAPVEVSPDEVAPVEVSSVEVAPVEVSPVEVAPVEVSPVEVAPVVVAPIEVAPIEVPPVGVAPVVVARVETAPVEAAPAHELATDGYHYKTQRRVVYRRQRRDVSHLSSNEYLPPVSKVQNQVHVADHSISLAPVKGTPVDAAPVKDAPVEVALIQDAPVEVSPVKVASIQVSSVEADPVVATRVETAPVEAAPAHELADDGYHYKTQRRVVYRRH